MAFSQCPFRLQSRYTKILPYQKPFRRSFFCFFLFLASLLEKEGAARAFLQPKRASWKNCSKNRPLRGCFPAKEASSSSLGADSGEWGGVENDGDGDDDDVTISISVVLLLSCTAFFCRQQPGYYTPGWAPANWDLHPSSVYTSGHGGRWHEARAHRRIPGV